MPNSGNNNMENISFIKALLKSFCPKKDYALIIKKTYATIRLRISNNKITK